MAQRQTMQRADSAMIPPAEQESIVAHLSRSSKNALYGCFGCLQTSKEKTLIKYKEYEIEQRKKTFGVTYINHKKSGQDDVLPECVEAALKDIENFETEIEELKSKIASVDEETKNRLVPAPGTPATGTKPSTTTTPAATTPAPETAVAPPETTETPSVDNTQPPSENPATSAPTAAVDTPEDIKKDETSPPAENNAA